MSAGNKTSDGSKTSERWTAQSVEREVDGDKRRQQVKRRRIYIYIGLCSAIHSLRRGGDRGEKVTGSRTIAYRARVEDEQLNVSPSQIAKSTQLSW